VSVLWLEHFIRENKGELRGKQTSEVSEVILKPRTKGARVAYVELLKDEHVGGFPAVAEATCFVSHAWSTDFLDLCECTITWAKTRGDDEVPYVWLDVFAVNQHQAAMPPQWWDTTFRNAVGALGHTLLVLTPWDKPVAVSRVWCLWEILCTVDQGCELTVLMPEREKRSFVEALKSSLDDVQQKVAAVDAEHAQAFDAEDRRRIFAEIRKLDRGFLDINNKVKDRLRQWTFEAGMSVLDEMPAANRATSELILSLAEYTRKLSQYELSEKLYREAVEGRRQQLGDQDPGTLSAIGGIGYLLEYQGKNAEAEPFLVEALEGRRHALGNRHAATLQSMNDLGNLYLGDQKFAEAEALYKEALEGRCAIYDANNYDVLQTNNNLGRLYTKMGQYQLAEPFVARALEGRRATLGSGHATTLYTMTRLAELRAKMDDREGAAQLYNEALPLQSKLLGDHHADTLSTKMHLGELELRSPVPLRRSKSLTLLQEAYAGFRLTAGEEHEDTTKAASLLRLSLSQDSLSDIHVQQEDRQDGAASIDGAATVETRPQQRSPPPLIPMCPEAQGRVRVVAHPAAQPAVAD
jgi:tetratricopeptide (TPR) repeat protein